ncbi:hypothetical protein [Pseudaestuariivita atlantica]|uniref:Uncharacterized protein n=1 Tax=Pseudaestuariivita atlantica TaxID=1317121 RepID=A0A0L1JV90_9RHOB|nr:hypothetical protein [Pseudaestuariivita atlantica]KNG95665.1 hypothetical protein ATO11_01420 [Pseudaestuariivita atlantica]
MPHPTKIATCCYCGTRAALVLKGRERHELACSACGAPLHNLKMLPSAKAKGAVAHEEAAQPLGGFFSTLHDKAELRQMRKKKVKSKGKKKRKGGMAWFLDEAFDAIEDIFD